MSPTPAATGRTRKFAPAFIRMRAHIRSCLARDIRARLEARAGVGGVKVGDRVAAFLEQGGAYEKAVAPANILMPLPEAIPFDVGAALPIQPLTGYHMLHTIYGMEPGKRC